MRKVVLAAGGILCIALAIVLIFLGVTGKQPVEIIAAMFCGFLSGASIAKADIL